MEHDVVLADEVYQLGLGVFPPFLPVFATLFANLLGVGYVADGGIEPHIEHLAVGTFERDGHAPIQVAGDSTGLQATVEPALHLAVDVRFPFLVAFEDPLTEPLLVLVEGKIPVFGGLLHQGCAAELRVRVDELVGAQRRAAFLALVAVGTFGTAFRAGTHDISVAQEFLPFGVEVLLRLLLDELAFVVQFLEELLRCGAVHLRRGARVDVVADA